MTISFRRVGWLLALLLLISCASAVPPAAVAPRPVVVTLPTAVLTPLPTAQLAARTTPLPPAATPLLTAYRALARAALTATPPILLLDGALTPEQTTAQALAVGDARVQPYLYESNTHRAQRVAVFGVYPLRDSDDSAQTAPCVPIRVCYRVELYNFALNGAIRILVNPATRTVLAVTAQANTQPDLPDVLTAVAVEIAQTAPEVRSALGEANRAVTPLMANTKTALNATRCERSQHLCVAPTFVVWGQALWAIVDLTDGVLVGTRWTQVGETGEPTSEQALQDAVVTAGFCDHTTHLEQDGWALDYLLTSSDGLRISDVRYHGTPLFASVKLVDWHVSYARTDGFGYSDAVGCPVFSQAAVIANAPPQLAPLTVAGEVVGFTLSQAFWSELWPRPCNYNYAQQYQFYTDGRFRPAAASLGRGCGNDGTYRPVTRIALAQAGTVQEWRAGSWQDWAREGWRHDDGARPDADGTSYRVRDAAGAGVALTWGRGQFGDGGRGDDGYVYVTARHADRDEGDADMMTIGPCCNTDEHQGPEQFIDTPPEPTTNTALVLWYVAQLKNDATVGKQYCWAESLLGADGTYQTQPYPCWSGPLLTLLRGAP